MKTPVDVTYLADSVILLRFFEAEARVRRAVSVIKKRTGFHEDTIREFRISNRGLSLGGPLTGFHGVLRGVPTYRGSGEPLLPNEQELMPGGGPHSERILILAPLGRDCGNCIVVVGGGRAPRTSLHGL